MSKLKSFFMFSTLCILLIFSVKVNAQELSKQDKSTNGIETVLVSMPVLTDDIDINVLSNKEIEDLINQNSEKYLKDVDSIDINHTGRQIDIVYSVNEADGEINDLINISIYNFLKSLGDFDFYSINFDVYLKTTDSNQRASKQKFASYMFKSETISSLDFEKIEYADFVSYADKFWTIEKGDEENDKTIEGDAFQLKIISILKSYIQYKISSSK